MKDIDRAGIAAIVEQAIAIAGKDAGGLHVSFDLDVCDRRSRLAWVLPSRRLQLPRAHMLMEMAPTPASCARWISSR